jgi:hypothetical protein
MKPPPQAALLALVLLGACAGTPLPTPPTVQTMTQDPHKTLRTEDCATVAPPFGDTVLYLRGTMNNWTAMEDYALQFSCDAYYLNTRLKGRHEFKLADAAWTPALTSEAITLDFDGTEQTLRAVIVAERPLVSLGARWRTSRPSVR